MAFSEPALQIKPEDIPAPPQSAMRVIHACNDATVDSGKLTDIITTDPVLTAELLRVVNSAFFAMSQDINSVQQAITIIGQHALRNLVMCLSVRDVLRHHHNECSIDTATSMDNMLRLAVCARVLAEEAGADPQECFTAGILQQLPVLVLFLNGHDKAPAWQEYHTSDPDQRHDLEQNNFGMTHEQIGASIAYNWQLPEKLAMSMAFYHSMKTGQPTTELPALCRILLGASWMASTFTHHDKRHILVHCKQTLNDVFAIDEQRCIELLEGIADGLDDYALSLGMRVRKQISFEQVMREANAKLAEENLSYQELVWKLEQTLQERDRLAEELQRDLDQAREIQRSLLPKRIDDFPIKAINIPAKQVSGDFYDFFTLSNGNIRFNIADVSGKGMNAALLMAKTSSLFRCVGKTETDLGKLLSMINREICETSVKGKFVTLIAGEFNPQTRQLSLINAGHQPALVINNKGEFREISASSPPLGITATTEFNSMQLNLAKHHLYLYTDGLTEYHHGKIISSAVLAQTFHDYARLPSNQRLQSIFNRLKIDSQTLKDDLTLMVIE